MSKPTDGDIVAMGALSVLGVLVMGLGLAFWRAFVAVKAWAWLLPAARPLRLLDVIVVVTVAQLVLARSSPPDPRPLGQHLAASARVGLLGPLMALGLAWAMAGRLS